MQLPQEHQQMNQVIAPMIPDATVPAAPQKVAIPAAFQAALVNEYH